MYIFFLLMSISLKKNCVTKMNSHLLFFVAIIGKNVCGNKQMLWYEKARYIIRL